LAHVFGLSKVPATHKNIREGIYQLLAVATVCHDESLTDGLSE
jgi:hypothetical protein